MYVCAKPSVEDGAAPGVAGGPAFGGPVIVIMIMIMIIVIIVIIVIVIVIVTALVIIK